MSHRDIISRINSKDGKVKQVHIFKNLLASHYLRFNQKSMALLYNSSVKINERDVQTRIDVEYPFERRNLQK
jgi:hypothetical protein